TAAPTWSRPSPTFRRSSPRCGTAATSWSCFRIDLPPSARSSMTARTISMPQLAIAVGEVKRFVAGTRDKTAEQVQRLANVTQVLADHRLDVENILHVAPTAFVNWYNIINPNIPGGIGSFIINNFSNPIQFICSSIGAIENTTAPE